MKHIIQITLAVVILVMMAATIIEKFNGTPYVGEHIYGAWWFVALWAILTTAGCAYVIKQKLYKRMAVMMLHISFVVVLIGALTTFLTSQRGTIHLRKDTKAAIYTNEQSMTQLLPFTLEVKDFNITYYPGTDAPLDYISEVIATDKEGSETLHISMNNIGTFKGYRLYQNAYDTDMQGTILGIAYDPYGIAITYMGYLLMLISIVCVMLSKHTRIRQLYRTASRKALIIGLLLGTTISVNAADNHHVITPERADKFGNIMVLYNNRICPINTVAIDFVTKLSGAASWDGLSANEIFTGWLIYSSSWENEKVIRIKDSDTQKLLGIDSKWASYNDFWDKYNKYKLEEPLQKAYSTGDEAALKHLRDADEKFNLIRMFYNGEFLRIFPYSNSLSHHERNSLPTGEGGGRGNLTWFHPGSTDMPKDMPEDEWTFVRKSIDYLTESIMTKDDATTDLLLSKMVTYQRKRGGDLLPSEGAIRAELIYNTLQTQRWPVFLALIMGIIVFACSFSRRSSKCHTERNSLSIAEGVGRGWNIILFAWLTTLLSLRWYISGHMPLSNGYETMQFMAWSIILLTIILQKPFPIIRAFGPLLAAFALLVALISGQNPQITQLMPVLQSPLLSIHVVVIMFSYALLAMTFIISLIVIVRIYLQKHFKTSPLLGEVGRGLESLTALSQLMLYPAVMCLTIGIFIGAVWANVSWGRYWSWDSKETWALITMLIYALPLHKSLFPNTQHPTPNTQHPTPITYHIYIVIAFFTVLMTYFGVNYFLTGMHSYANA